MPAVALAFIEMFGPWILRFFMLKAAFVVAKIFAVIGIGLATNAYVIDPLLDHIEVAWGNIPSSVLIWIDALGINNAVSIYCSAAAIASIEKVVLRKA